MTLFDALKNVVESESDILCCLQKFLCTTLEALSPCGREDITHIENKVDIAKRLICAMAAKEKSISLIIDSVANAINADKGIVSICDKTCDNC